MNTSLHVFKKDLRQFRVLLCVWIGIIALHCALNLFGGRPGDAAFHWVAGAANVLAALSQAVLMIAIVPQLVQSDSLVGASAFWLTRPISRTRLLGGKALFAAVLVALPIAGNAAALAANGANGHEMGLATAEMVLRTVPWALTLATLASLTPSFSRFALVGVIVIAAEATVGIALLWLRLSLQHLQPGLGYNPVGGGELLSLIKSRLVVGKLLALVGFAAVVVHQYLTRRTLRSAVAAIVLVLGTMTLTFWWKSDFMASPVRTAAEAFDGGPIKASLAPSLTAVSIDGPAFMGVPDMKRVSGELRISGIPSAYRSTATLKRLRLSLPDGTGVPAQPLLSAATDPARAREILGAVSDPTAVEAALGGVPLVNLGLNFTATTRPLFSLRADDLARVGDRPLSLSGDLELELSKYAVTAELPVSVGARYDLGSRHGTITAVSRLTGGVTISVEERSVSLLLARNDEALTPLSLFTHQDVAYVLCNRRRQEALLPKEAFNFDLSRILQFASGPQPVRHTVDLAFGPEPERRRYAPEMTEQWLAEAVLVRLEPTRPVRVPVALEGHELRLGNGRAETMNYGPAKPSAGAASDESLAAVLAQITLPARPTKAEVRDYIDRIAGATQRQPLIRNASPDDTQVRMLAAIGADNLDVLVAWDDAYGSPAFKLYQSVAIERLARPEYRDLIVGQLPSHPYLIGVVAHYGWQAAAREPLLAGLRDEAQGTLPALWIQSVAAFRDPATYPALKAYLIRCGNRQQTFNALRGLPGLDLRDAVAEAWTRAKSATPRERLDACGMAIEYGHPDALATAVEALRLSDGSAQERRRMALLVRRHTPATGQPEELVAWYDAHKDSLVFDPATGRFASGSAPSQPEHP